MDSAKQLKDLSKVYMEAVYGGGKKEEKKDTRLVVTAADKKANTKAYQNYKAGNKAYKAADHLKEDEKYGYDKDGNSLNPKDKKAKKDFDGDGKLESPEAEYKGSKDKAIKKEVEDLQKAANTGKGKYVAKADKVKVVGEETIIEKETPKQVAAVIDYYRSKKGTGEAVKDTEEGDTKDAKKERDYAAFERGKMKKDDPDWKHKKGSTSESVEAEKYIETIQQIKKAELQADIKRWTPEPEEGQKKVEEGKSVVKKEVEDLQTAAETGKGKYVAKADAQSDVGGTPASKQDEVEDPRSMYTKWNLVKNRLRAMGLKMSQELEGETIEESEKVAQGALKKAQKLGAERRKREGVNRGIGKNERAGYKLSQAARSSDSSLETQRTKKKRPAGDDTSQIGHYKNRDAKRTTSKTGKPLKKPVNKLSLSQRVDHHSNKALNRRDPKQNPKHTANESVQNAVSALDTYMKSIK